MSHHDHNELNQLRRERDLAVAVCKGLARFADISVRELPEYALRDIEHMATAAQDVLAKVEGKR